MKRKKQLGKRALSLLLALLCLATPAFGTAAKGDLAEKLGQPSAVLSGGVTLSAWATVQSRFGRLGDTFGAEVSLEVWTTLAAGGYSSAEDMISRAPHREDAISLCYAGDADRACVHVGRQVKPDCDLTAVEAALTDPAAGDFDRLMAAWRALWAALADGEAIYPTQITVMGSEMTQTDVETALAPLRQVFTGPVTVFYGRGETVAALADEVNTLRSSYGEDGLLLCYEETTGAVGVHVGTVTALKLTGAGKLPAAFAAGGQSGFTQGVEALAQQLRPMDQRGPWTIPLTAGAVALIALGELWWKRRRPWDWQEQRTGPNGRIS